ncbi:Rieske (2Fe-2S) protein [Streptomyces sp. NPDC051219]|uniref:Rieske (2Fe-2S) protein n=1 Tax=Streptomyces sp. NPDC051219 TaxID=3155283 RepID=UPI00341A19ED
MTGSQVPEPALGRRTVVAAVGVAGLAAALTACGGSEGSSYTGSPKPADGTDNAGAGAGAGTGTELAKTADIPEGGGKVFADQGVVVTQPTAGEFKAFSSKCTHQGCAVKDISDGTINCPCHGSKFDATDGSVKAGPATQALPAASIVVEGDAIKLA